jgi:hypothetical protein
VTLVNLIVILVLIGVIMWLINAYIPMGGGLKSLLNIVVFVVVLLWVLRVFGIVINIPGVRIPRLM